VDRISALRNIEEALTDFEQGETDLSSTERRIVTVLRTYATEFESEAGAAAYRATGDERAGGLVVVADSPDAARERIRELLDDGTVDFDVERVSPA
jgi:alkanesulfonate monooxygenase SsuD/methylene tetrahydromethanopterin reductase-like flavin-dependent oxidoreductase (luciferase family)